MPDNSTTTSTKEGNLILNLPNEVTKAHIVSSFKKNLISIPQVVDAGYKAVFDQSTVTIINQKTKKVSWKGDRNKTTGLWELPITEIHEYDNHDDSYKHKDISTPSNNPFNRWRNTKVSLSSLNNSSSKNQDIQQTKIHCNATSSHTLEEHINFLHQACGNPVKSTWLAAINNNHYKSWPNLTAKNVNKYLYKTIHTLKGHMQQTRKNKGKLRKIKENETEIITDKDIINDFFPQPSRAQTNQCFTKVINITGLTAMDLSGKFPITSSRGNKYIFLWYDYDSNTIKAIPIKSREKEEQVRAYNICYEYYALRGFVPQITKLDNEASEMLKNNMRKKEVKYQMVPPSIHRQNSAERAMRTWKEHAKATISTFDPDLPLQLWCQFLEAIDIQLNMLRASRLHPQISAHCHLNGEFDYLKTPMVPLGTKATIFVPPKDQKTWAYHAMEGYYLGPAMDHYKCHRIYISETKGERTSDTVEFHPKFCKMPYASSIDEALSAIKNLIAAVQKAQPKTPYSLKNEEVEGIKKLAKIFKRKQKDNATQPRVVETQHNDSQQRVPQGHRQPHSYDNIRTPTHRYPTRVRNQANALETIKEEPNQEVLKKFKNKLHQLKQTRIQQDVQQYNNNETDNKLQAAINIMALAVMCEDTGKLLNYKKLLKTKHKDVWTKSCSNEFGRLAQGNGTVEGTNTIFFINFHEMPKGRKATYANIVVDIRPEKKETHRTRMTVGGNLIEYPGNVSTDTADITTAKILFNSVLSTKNARFLGLDIKIFYLNNDMERYEYMKIPIDIIPQDIIDRYNLMDKVHNGYVYVEIRKGMYGLPQAGKIANDELQRQLAPHGYRPVKHTPGLWKHDTRKTMFTLVVDDFGTKIENDDDEKHLIETLQKYYTISIDREGKFYLGMTLDWDYIKRTLDISMPGYVQEALKRFHHTKPKQPIYSPSKFIPPIYGQKIQTETIDDSAPMSADETKRLEQVCGVFLYYARAVDPTMLHALNVLAY